MNDTPSFFLVFFGFFFFCANFGLHIFLASGFFLLSFWEIWRRASSLPPTLDFLAFLSLSRLGALKGGASSEFTPKYPTSLTQCLNPQRSRRTQPSFFLSRLPLLGFFGGGSNSLPLSSPQDLASFLCLRIWHIFQDNHSFLFY